MSLRTVMPIVIALVMVAAGTVVSFTMMGRVPEAKLLTREERLAKLDVPAKQRTMGGPYTVVKVAGGELKNLVIIEYRKEGRSSFHAYPIWGNESFTPGEAVYLIEVDVPILDEAVVYQRFVTVSKTK